MGGGGGVSECQISSGNYGNGPTAALLSVWGGGGQYGEVRSELLPGRVVCRHWISEKGATKSSKKEGREEININACMPFIHFTWITHVDLRVSVTWELNLPSTVRAPRGTR